MKICLVGAELFDADRGMARHNEANSVFKITLQKPNKLHPMPIKCHIMKAHGRVEVHFLTFKWA
jgi:hypothetical protein